MSTLVPRALHASSHVMLSALVQKLVMVKFQSMCLLISPPSPLVSLEELKGCNFKDQASCLEWLQDNPKTQWLLVKLSIQMLPLDIFLSTPPVLSVGSRENSIKYKQSPNNCKHVQGFIWTEGRLYLRTAESWESVHTEKNEDTHIHF